MNFNMQMLKIICEDDKNKREKLTKNYIDKSLEVLK